MQIDQSLTFNQQIPAMIPGQLSLDWKPGPVDKVEINAFVPITLHTINLKTPLWYEVVGNSIALLGEGDIIHATKAKPAEMPPENSFAKETSGYSDLNQFSFKH